ncbi:MAG: 6-bladed beta-propeller [Candidatus Aminicenantes bacterium]|nr:6-bladed beta-propeller [Candidatus Aminicenantes bacterium]
MKTQVPFFVIFACFIFCSFGLSSGYSSAFDDAITGQSDPPVIKNPQTPLYGSVELDIEEDLVLGSNTDKETLFYKVWDINADEQGNIYVLDAGAHCIRKYDKTGKYLQSLGRQGQGPGEFEMPIILALDKKTNIYVGEMVKIHMFDPKGTFVRKTVIPYFYMNFVPDGEGNFAISCRPMKEKGEKLVVNIVDSAGKTVKRIAEFPGLPVHETGTTVSHDYSSSIRLWAFGDRGFIFGHTPEYKFYIVDWTGKNILVFEKDEAAHPVTSKEKNRILKELFQNSAKAGYSWSKNTIEKMANLPKHRPFFDRIRVDDKGRIYIRKCKSVLDDSHMMEFDIFGNDGYFLYTTQLPFIPMAIKNGFLYHTTYSEETGMVKVIRYRIKNWDRLRFSR